VEPQRQRRLDSPVRRDQIEDSYVKSPDQYRFLKKLDRRVDKYAKTQYAWKLRKGEVQHAHANDPDGLARKNFLFGQKGDILFSE